MIGLYSGIIKRLLCSGDIETIPGPIVKFKKLSQRLLIASKDTKSFYINCQSKVQKKGQLQIIWSSLGDNTLYGSSKIWLKESNDQKHWEMKKDYFKKFRFDRKLGNKTKGGGFLLIIQKTLSPKSRSDLKCMNKNKIERIESGLKVISKTIQQIKTDYTPSKSLTDPLLEELSTSIDIAIVDNEPIALVGDFNYNFFWTIKND